MQALQQFVSTAYQTDSLIGAYATAPFKAYNRWVVGKVNQANGPFGRLIRATACVVNPVFVALAALAIVGTLLNLVCLPFLPKFTAWRIQCMQNDAFYACNSNSSPPDEQEYFKKIALPDQFEGPVLTITTPLLSYRSQTEDGNEFAHPASFQISKQQTNELYQLSHKYGWIPSKHYLQFGERIDVSNGKGIFGYKDFTILIPVSEKMSIRMISFNFQYWALRRLPSQN